MLNKLRSYFIFLILALLMTSNVLYAENRTNYLLDNIYKYLAANYPQYDGITFSEPSTNYLAQNWIIQTPDIWGKSVVTYNKSFSPKFPYRTDMQFHLPTCQSDNDCQGYAKCEQPNYTRDYHGNVKSLCVTPTENFLTKIYSAIISANHSVDITMMRHPVIGGAFATGAFSPTIRNALIVLARKTIDTGEPIQIRLLEGDQIQPLKYGNSQFTKSDLLHLIITQRQYLKYLTSQLPKGNKLEISVGSMRSCFFNKTCGNNDQQHDIYLNIAFNHGKIINIDNYLLITGGHNLYGEAYLQKNPVNDLSIEITGPVAHGATIYANALWDYVVNHKGILSNLCETYKNGSITDQCPVNIDSSISFHAEPSADLEQHDLTVHAMYVSKLNNGVLDNDADQSELARVFAFESAKSSIKISQQALFAKGFNHLLERPVLHPINTIAGTVMQALAKAIKHHVNVYIVTSSLNLSYSSYVKPDYIYQFLQNNLVSQFGLSIEAAANLLHQYLHIGYVAYNYQDKKDMSHNKLWIVDDQLFYIGSHNIYPSSLQQFGVIVSCQAATSLLEKEMWDPLWKYSVKFHQD